MCERKVTSKNEVEWSRDITRKTRANFTGLPCPPNFNIIVIARGEAPRVRQIIEAVIQKDLTNLLLFPVRNELVKLLVKMDDFSTSSQKA